MRKLQCYTECKPNTATTLALMPCYQCPAPTEEPAPVPDPDPEPEQE